MKVELSEFEKALLDRIIPTYTLNDSKGVQIALRNFIGDEKEQIMADQSLDERGFRELQSRSVTNIFAFLIEQQFMAEREGGVIFLTEKGKHLRQQKTLAGYEEWRKETRAKNKVIINKIETRGYLDQDEIIRNRRRLILKRLKSFIVYPLLILILLAFLILGAHHYHLDDNVPFIKNLFKKEKINNKHGGNSADGHHKKRHKNREE